ncbi:MAG TPA: UbiH/UbiF/VisC/COQ6 family ubiquinone biosynthesis hydroxylase [Gammaproteobacteria bacterium]|nr:UbiH/UbiF/VisC/COQ6 family ubiquinone biosynthesis hydroxylase [Gammaproteobacteria bacterium]
MYDVIIVGSGIVGLTHALLLSQTSSLRIAVLDAKPPSFSWTKENYDARVYAITPASQAVFKSIGIWADLELKRISRFESMEVWDSAGNGHIQFNHADLNVSELGFIIEESLLRDMLYERAIQQRNITFVAPVVLKELKINSDGIKVKTETEVLQGNLLVGADGAKSWVREHASISLKSHDYQHTAIIANVETELPHNNTARQCFVADCGGSPLAFLPLQATHASSIVWSLEPEMAAKLMALDDAEFLERLGTAFQFRLGKVVSITKRYSFPLLERHAETYIMERVALLGDAAHTLHPLAGQGVNLGVGDAQVLAQVIKEAYSRKRDYWSYSNLRRFERERKSANLIMLQIVKIFKELFASRSTLVSKLRNLGLNFVNQTTLIKKLFARYAMR